jgi:hypothetical protein
MGYYVQVTNADVFMSKDNFDKAYQAAIALNQQDDLKSGGGWTDELKSSDPRPEGFDYHPSRWFSWVDADYHITCKTLDDVLKEFRFETMYDNDGNLINLHFDCKVGDEVFLLTAIAPYFKDGSSLEWRGEEGETWKYIFENGKIREQQGVIVWEDINEVAIR